MATKQKTRPPAVEGSARPVVEAGPWPGEYDHTNRFLRLREYYSDGELERILDCSPEWVEMWAAGPSRRWIHHDLDFLNHLDAAVRATRAFERALGPERVRDEMFRRRERLDGRSFADIVAGREHFQAGRAVDRLLTGKGQA